MPGGKGNIKPEDGRQFGKGNKAAEKWTEDASLMFIDDLISWMMAEDENIFFSEFILLECDESKYPGKISLNIVGYLAKKIFLVCGTS